MHLSLYRHRPAIRSPNDNLLALSLPEHFNILLDGVSKVKASAMRAAPFAQLDAFGGDWRPTGASMMETNGPVSRRPRRFLSQQFGSSVPAPG